MRSRILSPVVLVLLSIVSLASVAGAQTSTPAASGMDIPAFLTSVASQPGCDTQAKALTGQPTPMFMVSGTPCGDCSVTACRGANPGTICAIVGRLTYICQDTDLVCSNPPGSPKCGCWATPI